jgi:hypothetical protein
MSKISRDGYEQILVIKNALDSMYDKLKDNYYTKNEGKIKDIEKQFEAVNVFESVKDEFQAIAGIVELSGTWEEVQ